MAIGHVSFTALDDLREFRDLIVLRVPGGKILARHYDLVKAPVASLVARKPFLREIYLLFFILPSLWLLQLRKEASRSKIVILNTMVFGVFLAGLAWTTALSIVKRLYVRE